MSLTLPSWLQALILGLVQGLTEFLPVSSSGHLVVAPYLLGLEQPTLALGVLLHLATLLAVVTYFRADLLFLVRGITGAGDLPTAERRLARRTVVLLAIASVPAATAGLLLEDVVSAIFEDPRVVAVALLATAGLLVLAERLRHRRAAALHGDVAAAEDRQLDVGRGQDEVTPRDALVVGCAQALAIIPGISRAGATIAGGMVSGLTRVAAARFSFLLSIPIIAGAGLLELREYEAGAFGGYTTLDAAIASVTAGLSGYWAIRFLLNLIATDDLTGFARYLVALALVVLAVGFVVGTG